MSESCSFRRTRPSCNHFMRNQKLNYVDFGAHTQSGLGSSKSRCRTPSYEGVSSMSNRKRRKTIKRTKTKGHPSIFPLSMRKRTHYPSGSAREGCNERTIIAIIKIIIINGNDINTIIKIIITNGKDMCFYATKDA